MTQKNSTARRRKTVRVFGIHKAIGLRLRQVMAEAGVTQQQLAEHLGGFRNETLSRICLGYSTLIPLDLMVNLAAWAHDHGFSLPWLFTGRGPMQAQDNQVTEEDIALLKLIKQCETITIKVNPVEVGLPSRNGSGPTNIKTRQADHGRRSHSTNRTNRGVHNGKSQI